MPIGVFSIVFCIAHHSIFLAQLLGKAVALTIVTRDFILT